jgi:hypothetical protein
MKRKDLPPTNQDQKDLLPRAFFREKCVAEEFKGAWEPKGAILRKMVLRILPLLLFLILIDLLLRSVLPPLRLLPYMQEEIAVYSLKKEYFLKKPTPDVLFIGSSRMRDSLLPHVFDEALSSFWGKPVRSYNLALRNAKSEEYYALVTSCLPDPPPPYVVIGFSGTEIARVHNFTVASRFLWRFPNLISYLSRTPGPKIKVKHVEYYMESLVCSFWYLFEQRDALARLVEERIFSFFGKKMSKREAALLLEKTEKLRTGLMADNGYMDLNEPLIDLETLLKTYPRNVRIQERELTQHPGVLDQHSFMLLRLIVTSLREMGCRVALVEVPPSPHLQKKNPVLHGVGFRKWMIRAAQEMEVLFIPFVPEQTGLTDRLYNDPSHLDVKGAARYTQILFRKLRRAGFFGDGPR